MSKFSLILYNTQSECKTLNYNCYPRIYFCGVQEKFNEPIKFSSWYTKYQP